MSVGILCEYHHWSLSSGILLCIKSVGWVGYGNIIRKLIVTDVIGYIE